MADCAVKKQFFPDYPLLDNRASIRIAGIPHECDGRFPARPAVKTFTSLCLRGADGLLAFVRRGQHLVKFSAAAQFFQQRIRQQRGV